jgi:hypothetical protein
MEGGGRVFAYIFTTFISTFLDFMPIPIFE